jgi:hypothetical protein
VVGAAVEIDQAGGSASAAGGELGNIGVAQALNPSAKANAHSGPPNTLPRRALNVIMTISEAARQRRYRADAPESVAKEM